MNKRNFKLYLGLLAVGAAVAFFLTRPDTATAPLENKIQPSEKAPGTPSSESFVLPSPDEEKMFLSTSDGKIAVNNIYKNPVEKLGDNGIVFASNQNYIFSFYPQDQGFIITILNPDVPKTIDKAGNDFLEILGVAENQACQLKVSITIPMKVNEEFSGSVLGFNFCNSETEYEY